MACAKSQMQAAPLPIIFETSGPLAPGLRGVYSEYSEDRATWTVHVVTPIGNGIGFWKTKLWEIDKASMETDT
jgi:hypothetical protein